jgi:hypothetical protein
MKNYPQTEKLSPQLHVLEAFGLLKVNPFPFNPSVKSNSVPKR